MVDEFVRDGYWTNELFYDFYDRNAREMGDREALVDSRYRVTWAEAKRLVDAIAASWVEMGIPKSARIIIQSPNSVFGFLARVAGERAGLITLTVYPYLRQRELEYMVEKTEATAVVIPTVYRKFDYLEMYKGLQKQFPHLEKVFLFDDEVPASAPEGTHSLIKMAHERAEKPVDENMLQERRLDPFWDVAILTTTSGTTGIPKLVEWPTAPRVCTSKGRVDIWGLNKNDITMAIAPHAGGAAGTLTYFAAPLAGAKTVMLEEFTPEGALELIQKERNTKEKPLDLVFHGGSGSEKEKITEAISYGVVKMNIDTDTQWAFTHPVKEYMDKNDGYLHSQIGNPEGSDKPNKKKIDPRAWLLEGEKGMTARLIEAFKDLNSYQQFDL
ncbi:MAG: AMP-binding protein [Spirochaetes bacterium]|jgi:non-ribosomal peptide synthetase component E (peptide arylation enzyme)|nr:AMP-binding protein [Spirochaetota bacterium]